MGFGSNFVKIEGIISGFAALLPNLHSHELSIFVNKCVIFLCFFILIIYHITWIYFKNYNSKNILSFKYVSLQAFHFSFSFFCCLAQNSSFFTNKNTSSKHTIIYRFFYVLDILLKYDVLIKTKEVFFIK